MSEWGHDLCVPNLKLQLILSLNLLQASSEPTVPAWSPSVLALRTIPGEGHLTTQLARLSSVCGLQPWVFHRPPLCALRWYLL